MRLMRVCFFSSVYNIIIITTRPKVCNDFVAVNVWLAVVVVVVVAVVIEQ